MFLNEFLRRTLAFYRADSAHAAAAADCAAYLAHVEARLQDELHRCVRCFS
jgi:hypothetical protein